MKLIAGYIHDIEKDFSQIIPSEINKLLFEYYYNPLIWRQDGFHGDGISFVDDHTIIPNQTVGTRGIAVMDTVIDGSYDNIFDWKVIIKNLNGLVTIGFFGADEDNNPDIKTKSVGYNDEIHHLNGAMIAIWTRYDHCWTCLDPRFNGVKATEKLYYPNGRLDASEADLSEMEIGIRFDMKEHKMNVYFNNVFLGAAFHGVPDKIIPAIGLYSYECTVIIKQEEISCTDKAK